MLYRNRFYSPTLGRFLTRDPIGYDAGDVSIYRCVFNNPLISTDAPGLGNGMHSWPNPDGNYAPPSTPPDTAACCNGVQYDPAAQCCENDVVVDQVSVRHCTRPLNNSYVGPALYNTLGVVGWGSNHWLPQQPRHSYICCDGANKNCFGMQQTQKDSMDKTKYYDTKKTKPVYTKKGDSISKEYLTTGVCYEHKVCPSSKKSTCDNPKAPYDYNWHHSNCNVWAAGIIVQVNDTGCCSLHILPDVKAQCLKTQKECNHV